MFQTVLVVLTTSTAMRRGTTVAVTQLCSKFVQGLTYVHLINENTVNQLRSGSYSIIDTDLSSGGRITPTVPLTQWLRRYVTEFYTRTASSLNVRFILSNFSNDQQLSEVRHHILQHSYDVILTDLNLDLHSALRNYLATYFQCADVVSNATEARHQRVEVKRIEMDNLRTEQILDDDVSMLLEKRHRTVCVGGTFDRLHVGHKILLSEACLRCTDTITVGVTDGQMNASKLLAELLETLDERMEAVRQFLSDISPFIHHRVVPITDPYGPTILEPDLECLIVSEETLRGGHSINAKRSAKGMPEMELNVIELVEDGGHLADEEEKVSSSSARRRLLGTLLRPPRVVHASSNRRPYVIGLTGGTASGKTSIGKRLQKLGAVIIDCDQLGHKSYLPGTDTFHQLIKEFGSDIIAPDGTIDRKRLGPKVFSNPDAMRRLNTIVWPAISKLAEQELSLLSSTDVVVLDAAVLLEAGWESIVNEVWTTVISRDEATKRLVDRNGLSVLDAALRLDAQMTNEARVRVANVVLCTLWEYDVTQKQVEKAWALLQDRRSRMTSSNQ